MTKPTILIYVFHPDAILLKEVCAGIEEESVNYEIISKEKGDIEELTYESANHSVLQTGIGICNSVIALSLSSLPKGKYVFRQEQASAVLARIMGTNAARAVKRKAFKEIIKEVTNP